MIVYDLQEQYPITKLCKYLKISTSGYYRWKKLGRPIYYSFDETLADKIETIFYETYKGYRFIHMQLIRKYGIVVNPKTVYRYMKMLQLSSPIRKKRYLCCTKQDPNEKARIVHNNALARDFSATRPLEKLVTDISYIHHKNGRLYLSIIKDLYDNSIVAYKVSKFNDLKLVMDTISQICNENWNASYYCLLHSDQGFQYTNMQYIRCLDNYGITISHSRKANCYDNACCENFFSHIKSEKLELYELPQDEEQLRLWVDEYISFYNYDRPQHKLKGMTPFEFRKSYLSS